METAVFGLVGAGFLAMLGAYLHLIRSIFGQIIERLTRVELLMIEGVARLSKIEEVQAQHTATLSVHGRILGEHSRVLGEHSRVLGEHSRILGEHGRILGEHSRVLDEHSRKLDALSGQVSEQGRVLAGMAGHGERITTLEAAGATG